MNVVWGASGFYHDAAITVIKNGDIVFASSAERFSRIKNDPNLCRELLDEALSFGRPNVIMWYESPAKRFLRCALIDKKISYISPKLFFKLNGISCPIKYCSHHESHLNASLFTSPFKTDKSLGVVIDSVGEFTSTSFWSINYKRASRISSTLYPNSLGLFYSAITQMLGLKPQEEEYIMMGMAAYGKSHDYYYKLKRLLFSGTDLKVDLRRGCEGLFSDKEIEDHRFDIALGAQLLYEELFITLCKKYLHKSKANKIILGGGCLLNCVANSKLYDMVDDVWIFPNPGDAGASLGAALSYKKDYVDLKNMFLGHDAGNLNCYDTVVDVLIKEKVVGVMHGKAEFGPRALGNRSVLADPRDANIKNIVNDIKGRERFRPFAPLILEEHARKYFNLPCLNSPYMSFVFNAKNVDDVPGIAHVDNTARIQTVNKDSGSIYKILNKWYLETGCPVLINTSLNMKGFPLLNKVQDVFEFKDSSLCIITPSGVVRGGRLI